VRLWVWVFLRTFGAVAPYVRTITELRRSPDYASLDAIERSESQ
jgi:hypothetical protein